MTVMVRGACHGSLMAVASERHLGSGDTEVAFKTTVGGIDASLRVGASSQSSLPLRANLGLASQGVILCGSGFQLSREEAADVGLGSIPEAERYIRPYVNGQDFAAGPRGGMVLDFYGLAELEVLDRFPAAYQWLLERVKPIRASNSRALYRDRWWVFCEPRSKLRAALRGIQTYAATLLVSKHHIFHRVDASVVADARVVVVALDDEAHFGVLQSRAHRVWSLASGGRQGVGNDPVYNTTRCFDPFPFPQLTEASQESIGGAAVRLDSHRRERQRQFPGLTFTDMYNVLEKIRAGEPLTPKDQAINSRGRVSILEKLHDDLDVAVFEAYGWSHDLTDEQILERLVALNAERGEEERTGTVRWLRPDLQNKQAATGHFKGPGPAKGGTDPLPSAPPGPGIRPALPRATAPKRRASKR
jgi:hypothetical protein